MDRAYLLDIRDAAAAIERHAGGGRAAFDRDELVQVWMVHHLRVIGEACRQLSDPLKSGHPEVPWRQIVAMRNILVHHYFGVDLGEVWVAVERDVPALRSAVETMLLELGPEDLDAPDAPRSEG